MKAALIILITLALLFAGCTSTPPPVQTVTETVTPTPTQAIYEIEKDGLAITYLDYDRVKIQDKVYLFTIEGTAKNIGEVLITYAEVRGKFKFVDGTVFASPTAEVYDLQPGESWQFSLTSRASTSADNYNFTIGKVETG
jgi:hypothetical protein